MKGKNIYMTVLILFLFSCNFNKQEKENNNTNQLENKVENKVDSLYVLPHFEMDSFVDKRDNKIYHTLKIGEQIWSVDNISYIRELLKTHQWSKKISYPYNIQINNVSLHHKNNIKKY
jgi:hypothetical protein